LGFVSIDQVDSEGLTAFVQRTSAEPYEVVLDWSQARADEIVIAS